jgi:putative ATP-binding cassette transporter
LDNFWHIIQKQKQLVWINSGYSQIAIIFPFVVTIPRYLTKQITLGGLMQISTAFGRVQDALSYVVDMYASIAEWQAVVDRLTGFGVHMQAVHSTNPQINLERDVSADNKIVMGSLEIGLPNDIVILNNINVTLNPGTNVLIKGVSGSGKSTLLRAIAGIWPYTRGKIVMPAREEIMFVPQKPYLPLGTLRESVLYPGTLTRDDAELATLMKECHISYLIKDLDIVADWAHVLSVGEQQRLAFVRTLIYKPKWLFLDEATAALDEETEAAMYNLVADKLPKTTVVSVGHRSSINKFHKLELYLEKSTGEVSIKNNCY